MSEPFITPTELQVYLSLPANNMDDQLAMIAIEAACQVVRDELRFEVTPETKTLLLTGNGTSFITLPLPLIELDTVTVFEPDGTEVTEEIDYHADSNQIEWPDNYFTHRENGVRVLGTWGWEDPNGTVKIVALQVAARIYELGISTADNVGGVSATSIGGAGQLNELEKTVLYPLRRLM